MVAIGWIFASLSSSAWQQVASELQEVETFSLFFFSIFVYLFQSLQKFCNTEKGLWVYIKYLNITYPVSAKLEAPQQMKSAPVIFDKVPKNILLQVLFTTLEFIYFIQRLDFR